VSGISLQESVREEEDQKEGRWELARMPRPETRILKADALAIKLRILYI